MGEFKKFVPGRVDTEMQEKKKLGELEELIFKPHRVEKLEELTEEELEKYLSIDIEDLYKTKMNTKTIAVTKETQKILREYKERLIKKSQKSHDKESNSHGREDDEDAR